MHRTSIEDAETGHPGRYSVSASGPPLAGAVVLSFPLPCPTAAMAWEDEASLPEDPPSIGELAVRIVGNFKLPRLFVRVAGPEGED